MADCELEQGGGALEPLSNDAVSGRGQWIIRALEAIGQALDDGSIDYCILHGWQDHLHYTTSDVDIVVAPSDLVRMETVFRSAPFVKPVQVLQHEGSCYYFVFSISDAKDLRIVALDVATDFRRDGCVFFTAQELLRERRRVHGLWVAAPDVEFAYLLAKKISKGALPLNQRSRLQELRDLLGPDAANVARRVLGSRWGDRLGDWLVHEDWPAIERVLDRLKWALRSHALRRAPLNIFHYWVPELRRRWRRWCHPTGFMIAVLGPDGAGKTTLIGALQKAFAGAFRHTEIAHWPVPLVSRASPHSVTAPHRHGPRPIWFSVAKIAYYVLLSRFHYVVRVRPSLIQSTLVLFDRYYDDVLVDPRRYRYGGPRWLVWLTRRLVASPDLYLVLDASEDHVLQRKSELSREELSRQRQGYQRLAMSLPAAVLVDVALPPAEVAHRARDVILDCLHHRYLKRRTLWFASDGGATLERLTQALHPLDRNVRAVLEPIARGRGGRFDPQVEMSYGWLSLRDGRGFLFPLGSRQAAVAALDLYNAQGLTARLTKNTLAIGMRLGLGIRILPRVRTCRLNGQGHDKGMAALPLVEHLRRILGCKDLQVAISLGTPGPHRKPVLLALTKDGRRLAYAKVGTNEVTNNLVRHEATVLERLTARPLASFMVPSVLFHGPWNDRYLSVLSPPPRPTRPASRELTGLHLAVLRELATIHQERRSLEDSASWVTLERRINTISNSYYRGAGKEIARSLRQILAREVWPFHYCHGDFAPWNTKMVGSELLIFDWEYATELGLPAYDLIHFQFQRTCLLEEHDSFRAYTRLLRDRNQRWVINAHLSFLGMCNTCFARVLALYAMKRFVDVSSMPETTDLPRELHALRGVCQAAEGDT